MMKKSLKRLLTGALTLATVITAIPSTAVHASGKQYWTDGVEKAGYVEKVLNDASTRMSADQIADVALSLEYVKQYSKSHKELN